MIKFTISSHINSYEKTFNVLIPTLLSAGILPNDIYFFIGGYNNYNKIYNKDNINVYEVPHNSMDFTGLISVIELGLINDSNYWFLLHDTCYVGSEFNNILKSKIYHSDAVILTNDGFSMNIGLYKNTYIENKSSEILKLKNIDYTVDGLMNHKRVLINSEDIFIKNFKTNFYLNSKPRITTNADNFYQNNIKRICEYFPDIDLYKIKANWNLKPIYELNV